MLTTDVENYPGFPDGITGPELMANMREQAKRFGADLRVTKVQKLDATTRPFRAWLTGDDEPSITADTVILATGARSLMMNVPGEERLLSHGLSTCATCDGFFFRGQDIAVIGGGDSAMEEATVPHPLRVERHRRAPSRRASRVEDHAGACLRQREDPLRVEHAGHRGSRRGEGVRSGRARHRDRRRARARRHRCLRRDRSRPKHHAGRGQVDLEENGYVRTGLGSYTEHRGLFAAGDVQDHVYRQAVTSAGSGCIAAIDAERWLEAQGH